MELFYQSTVVKTVQVIFLQLLSANPTTLYCGCTFDSSLRVDLASCHMEAAGPYKRAHYVEWEHIMPAENIGKQRECWQKKICIRANKPYKGRKCCELIDPVFQKEEAELYNIWPSVGLVNQARSNYRYSPLETKNGFFGCDFEVDKKMRKVEPADTVKGIVARANLFMAYKYGIDVSEAQLKLFAAWDKQFPPQAWEREWATKVMRIEGHPNPYIENHRIN